MFPAAANVGQMLERSTEYWNKFIATHQFPTEDKFKSDRFCCEKFEDNELLLLKRILFLV